MLPRPSARQKAHGLNLLSSIRKNTNFINAGTRSGIETGSRSHEYRLTFIFKIREAPCTELVGIIYRKFRYCIESAHRDGWINTGNTVQTVNQAFTTLYIFIIRFAWIFFRSIQRSFCSNLSNQRRTQTSLTELHDSIAYLLVFGYQRTNTNTTFWITFGYGVINTTLFSIPSKW